MHDPPKPTLRTSILDIINLTRAKDVPIQATIARNDSGSNATPRLPVQRLTVVPSKTLSPSIYLHVYHAFKPASTPRNSKDPSHHHTSATNYAPHDPQTPCDPVQHHRESRAFQYPTKHSTPELNGASWHSVHRPRICDYEGYRVRYNDPAPYRCPKEATTSSPVYALSATLRYSGISSINHARHPTP